MRKEIRNTSSGHVLKLERAWSLLGRLARPRVRKGSRRLGLREGAPIPMLWIYSDGDESQRVLFLSLGSVKRRRLSLEREMVRKAQASDRHKSEGWK